MLLWVLVHVNFTQPLWNSDVGMWWLLWRVFIHLWHNRRQRLENAIIINISSFPSYADAQRVAWHSRSKPGQQCSRVFARRACHTWLIFWGVLNAMQPAQGRARINRIQWWKSGSYRSVNNTRLGIKHRTVKKKHLSGYVCILEDKRNSQAPSKEELYPCLN